MLHPLPTFNNWQQEQIMDFLFGAFNSFINNLPEGLQIEGLR
ncbi:MAG: hypothetical protein ACI92E_002666, partial [Oceanicoccus sp.]